MITMLTARTSEIDEVEIAVADIMRQIDLTALKKNSGGIIFCHLDFVESGVVAALCKALPFEVIGMTSMANMDQQGYGLFDLTLTVLTSNEVHFKAGMTNGITQDSYVDEIKNLCATLKGRAGTDPAMIFTFMPYMRSVSGDEVVAAIDAASTGVPLWGSITNSVDFTYETVQTLCNGEARPAGIAMMYVVGPVTPHFVVSSLPERNIAHSRAIVTRSDKAILYEINGMPVQEYLARIGLVITRENITATPLMVYFKGTEKPVALGMYSLFEDGSILTGGAIPVGSSFAVGSIDTEGIFESAESALQQIAAYKNRNATLMLPCVTRYIMLAPEQEGELELIQKTLSSCESPFMMGYSGGEICPTMGTDGKYHNHFHNYSFCACIL